MKELFSGHRELFKGLWIDSSDYDFKPYPVIQLSMTSVSSQNPQDLTADIIDVLEEIASRENIALAGNSVNRVFGRLIEALYRKYDERVVVLIDEYEAPILRVIDDQELAKQNRATLKNFYGILKDKDEFLRFIFITGVTKFAQASIFSDLNHLVDITLEPEYANICGFTLEELDHLFVDHMDEVLTAFKSAGVWAPESTTADLRREILAWYDGYSWDGKTRVLNPFSLMNFLRTKNFTDFWFNSGTPTFLIDIIKNNNFIYNIISDDNSIMESLNTVEVGRFSPRPLMFQSGYLTVERVEGFGATQQFYLKVPNHEVQSALFAHLLARETDFNDPDELRAKAQNILKALKAGDAAGVEEALKSLLAAIPHRMHVAAEGYYHTVFYLTMAIIGQPTMVEKSVAKGVVDGVVLTSEGDVFIVEMKYLKKTRPRTAAGTAKPASPPQTGRARPVKENSVAARNKEKARVQELMHKESLKAFRQMDQKEYAASWLRPGRKVFQTSIVVHDKSDVLVAFRDVSAHR
jgi:hypothetical protein